MEEINYEHGGCIVSWNIENVKFWKDDKNYNPVFLLEGTEKTKWTLSLFHMSSLFLERDCCVENVTISYSCSLSLNSSITHRKGLITFNKGINHCFLNNFSIINKESTVLPTDFNIRCFLHVISDKCSVLNEYRFRSIVEAEQRRVKYVIPNIKSIHSNIKFTMPIASMCNQSIPLEVLLNASEKDFDVECIQIDITGKLWIDIILAENNNSDVGLVCKLTVVDSENKSVLSATHEHEFEMKKENVWRFPSSIDIKDLNLKPPKDDLSLEFEFWISEHKINTWVDSVIVGSQRKVTTDDKAKEVEKVNLKDDLMCLYLEQKFTDVEISAGGIKFPAHKAILCARSPVFCAMFENNMVEKETNSVDIVDLDKETVDQIMFFMYSEILRDDQWCNVTKLYAASDKYQIMALKDKCSSILKEQLSVGNACEALVLSDLHSDPEFQNSIQDFIVTNSDQIFQSKEWEELMNCYPKIACSTMQKEWNQRTAKRFFF